MYMKTFDDVNTVAGAFIGNLGGAGSGDNKIFTDIAESAFAGTVWKTLEDHPDQCSLPYISAILLQKDGEALMDYIKGNRNASLL